MAYVYPSVREGVTRFSREALAIRDKRLLEGMPTVTVEQLDCRYQNHCGPCEEFGGVVCNRIGCSSKAWCINSYFDMVLDPGQKCRFKETGFPAITENP